MLIGDIPGAEWECVTDLDSPNKADWLTYRCFRTDYYYMDLDLVSNWQDTKSWNGEEWIMAPNGVFETMNWGATQFLAGDIFCARIVPSPIDSYRSQTDSINRDILLIQNYLRSVIEFRLDPPTIPHRAYMYVGDDWYEHIGLYKNDISPVFLIKTIF